MSWLNPANEDREYVEKLKQDELCYRLLKVLALALRIEPLLLRNARLHFIPASDIEIETQIWFSSIMHSRNAKACVIRGGIARALVDELAKEKDPDPAYKDAWTFVQNHTRHWSVQDQLEQELRLAARKKDSTALHNGLNKILKTLLNEEDPSAKRDLSRWIKGAMPTLFNPDKADEMAHLLFQYTAAALGLPATWSNDRRESKASMPQWLIDALPPSKANSIGIQLRKGLLECLEPASARHTLTFNLPLPTPALLTVNNNGQAQWESLWVGKKIRIPQPIQSLTLQMLDGKLYRFVNTDKKEDENHPGSPAELLLVYMPGDFEQARQISDMLRQQDIDVELVQDLAPQDISVASEDRPMLRVWSKASADYWQKSMRGTDEIADRVLAKGLLLRTDPNVDLPAAVAKQTRSFDLIDWNNQNNNAGTQQLVKIVRDWLSTGELVIPVKIKEERNSDDDQNPAIVPPPIKEEPIPNVAMRGGRGQIYISYAHADDQPFAQDTRGWVTNFVEKLQIALSMKSGGSQIRCWMDHRLETQRSVDDNLRRLIRDSQCILAFMSPHYLKSEWCKKEMATLVELVGGGKANDRAFLVELLPTERGDWHKSLHSITAIKFWDNTIDQPEPITFGWPVPNPKTDRAYWEGLNNLASILARKIQRLSLIPSNPPTMPTPSEPAPAPSSAKVVWVADPTDDVLDYWESLVVKLQRLGCRVLPKAAGQYNFQDETLFRGTLNGDLAQADLLVQLLGTLPGKKPAWADVRFVQLQAEAAKAEADRRKLSFLCWHKPDIDLDSITDTSFRALLAAATPLDFEAFCQQIIERLSTPPTPTSSLRPSGPLTVLILADKPDRDLGKQAQDILGELEVDAILAAEPLPTQAPAQYRQHLETQLEDSHGVLIVYGAAPPSWVQSSHSMARKVLALHRKGIWEALLDGPPEQKHDHGLNIRNLMLLDCRRGLSPDQLKPFVESLRQGMGHV